MLQWIPYHFIIKGHSMEHEQDLAQLHASSLDNRSLTMNILVTPSMSNFSGLMHGGELLKILDQVAYACATRYCGVGVITLSVDSVTFRQPIPIGTLLTFLASVNHTGKTSCEVGIKVISENIKERFVTHCVSCYFTMVAFKDGKSVPIPPLEPRTPDEKRRYEAAIKRREIRNQSRPKS